MEYTQVQVVTKTVHQRRLAEIQLLKKPYLEGLGLGLGLCGDLETFVIFWKRNLHSYIHVCI